MKSILIFVVGMVTGAILLAVISLGITASSAMTEDVGVTLFETQGESLSENKFKVIQVLDTGDALALENSDGYNPNKIVVLFYRQEGKYYYDDEIIKVPAGKCVRQIGVYQYSTQFGEKTVPIVRISNK